MATMVTRTNAEALRWLTGGLFAAVTLLALRVMEFYPPWAIIAAALAVGALALNSPPLAALLFVTVCGPAVLAADFVVGVLFLVVGYSATQYLGADRAQGFLAIALALVASAFGAEWAVAALIGYFVGRVRGATAAFLTCAVIEMVGLLLGVPTLGRVFVGGSPPGLLIFAAPENALTFGWLPTAIAEANPARVLDVLRAPVSIPALLVQPLLWAAAGALGATYRGVRTGPKALIGVLGAIAVLAVGTLTVDTLLADGAIGPSAVVTGAIASAVLASLVVLAAELLFPLEQVMLPPRHSTQTEDADVDDLLRLIASAEAELAAKHRMHGVVLITDMKSFSAMTESLGSIETAKLVQRHRDLLLPVIDRFGGSGKSTGGDGLVAAFPDAPSAVAAAVEMQRALGQLRGQDPALSGLAIRIGIAEGEVVCDKGGRPFIGAALNLAARTMDLADGGHIMIAGRVAENSGMPADRVRAHGVFKLKNIAEPVPVTEILWNDQMRAQEIALG